MSKNRDKIEKGDWQTPSNLASAIVAALCSDLDPDVILEPTCGKGSFLKASKALFPKAKLIGFDISQEYVDETRRDLPDASVEVVDFFEADWKEIIDCLDDDLLIIGNPPWVTASTLGVVDSTNRPKKKDSRKRSSGLDALTGKSNFDISEAMIMTLIEDLEGRSFTMIMICKSSIARSIIKEISQRGLFIKGELYHLDTKKHFSVVVDAVVIRLRRSIDLCESWPVFEDLKQRESSSFIGVIGEVLCPDIIDYNATLYLEGKSDYEWRSGIKHDCSKVMELTWKEGFFWNGLGEKVEIEENFVYPLFKGSDVANGRKDPRKFVIVTQKKIGEETAGLVVTAPKLWNYLNSHREYFDKRKSKVYRNRPSFSMFGVGDYSFSKYKVAICGLYKKLIFSVLGPLDGKPTMVDDTVYFLSCSTESEAEGLLSFLSSKEVIKFFESRIFWDSKRPINKEILQKLRLEKR